MSDDLSDFKSDDDRILSELPSLTIPETTDTTDTSINICSFNCSEQQTKQCRKCNRNYCVLHSSHFSPNLCQDCFKNVQLVLDKFSRTFEYINPHNGQAHYRKESCSDWHIDGPDWPFLNLWINKLTDDELKEVWMFHFFVIKTIEVENDLRKVKNSQKLANMPTPRPGQIKTTTTKTTKTTTITTADDIRNKLKKAGIVDPVIIESMVKAAGF